MSYDRIETHPKIRFTVISKLYQVSARQFKFLVFNKNYKMCRFSLQNNYRLKANKDYTFFNCTFNYIPLSHQPFHLQSELHMINYAKIQENESKFPEIDEIQKEDNLENMSENDNDDNSNNNDHTYSALHSITEEIYHTLQKIIMYNKNIETCNTEDHTNSMSYSTQYSLFTSVKETFTRIATFDMFSEHNKYSILGKVKQHNFYMPKSGKIAYIFKVAVENYDFNVIKWKIAPEEYKFYKNIINDVTLFLGIKILKNNNKIYFMIDNTSMILYDISNIWKSVIEGTYNETIIHNIDYIWSSSIHKNMEVVKQLNTTIYQNIDLAIKKAHEINNNTIFIMKHTKDITKYNINEFTLKSVCRICKQIFNNSTTECCSTMPQKQNIWFEGNISLSWKNYYQEVIINFTGLVHIIKYIQKISNLPINNTYEQYMNNLHFYKKLLEYNKPKNEHELQSCIYPVRLFFNTITENDDIILRFYIIPKIWKNQKYIRMVLTSIHSKSEFNSDLYFNNNNNLIELIDNKVNVNDINTNKSNLFNNNSNIDVDKCGISNLDDNIYENKNWDINNKQNSSNNINMNKNNKLNINNKEKIVLMS